LVQFLFAFTVLLKQNSLQFVTLQYYILLFVGKPVLFSVL